jgi:hypothetical protein
MQHSHIPHTCPRPPHAESVSILTPEYAAVAALFAEAVSTAHRLGYEKALNDLAEVLGKPELLDGGLS